MKRLVALLLTIALCSPAFASTGTPLDAQIRAAERLGKPIIVHFSATWCSHCRTLQSTVYGNPSMKPFLSKFTIISVDASNPTAITRAEQQEFGVYGFPEAVVFNKSGQQVTKILGDVSPTEFKAEASKGL